jgi:hypothetical protein
MSNQIHFEKCTLLIHQDTKNDVLQEGEETEAVSVWEISRRRFRHCRHTAAQACTQGKRRQLRRLSGRNR